MMLTGKQLKAAKAKKAGLVDMVVEQLGKRIFIYKTCDVKSNS